MSPEAPAPEAAPAGFLRRHGRVVAASFLVLCAFVFVMNRGALPILPSRDSLAAVSWFPALGFFLGYGVHTITRAARPYFLIRPIAHIPLRRIVIINGFAIALITFLPFRLGEVYRPAMMRKQGALSAWEITGTVFAERIIDGLLYALLLLAGLLFAAPHEPVPSHIGSIPVPASLVPRVAAAASTGFGIAFVVLVFAYRFRAFARNITERILGSISTKLGKAAADVVERLANGLGFLRDAKYTIPYLGVTLLADIAHVWAVKMLALAVGLPDLTFAQAGVITGVLALGFAFPNAPGFFGAVQLALYAGLANYVAPEHVVKEGAVLVFIFYLTFLAFNLLSAVAALALASLSPEDP
jgi:hypothetical protein